MADKLSQLKAMTTIVADTGDINSIKKYSPEDATTNPTLLLKAAQSKEYESLVTEAVQWAREQGGDQTLQVENTMDKLAVNFGKEILKIIPGRISTEVDARLSFDSEKTVDRVKKLIKMYNNDGVPNNRVLIKIAATWEGIQAAERLEKENINCNLTLLFGFCQAIACAQAGVYLISPFVGRILDWYRKTEGKEYTAKEDPGVLSVRKIYMYYKKFSHSTVIMGASFRNAGEIEELAGCDRLTIGPNFLEELQQDSGELTQKLSSTMSFPDNLKQIELDESKFRWMLNEDAMATEKLAEGIRKFSSDLEKLEVFVKGY